MRQPKNWVLLLILLLLVSLAAGYFWFNRNSYQPLLPTGWQVHQDQAGGFEIGYPADWKKEVGKGRVRFLHPQREFSWLALWFGPTVAHGEEFARRVKVEEIKIAGITTKKEYLKIDKNLFLEQRSEEEYQQIKDNKMVWALIKKDGKEYYFEFVYQQPEEEELFDQFVNSFHFWVMKGGEK